MNKRILQGLLIGFALIFCLGAVAVNQWQIFRQPVTFGAQTYTTVGIGTKGTGATLEVKEYGSPTLHHTELDFTALSMTMTDVSGQSTHGSKLIYTFPAGSIVILGTKINLEGTNGTGGISDTGDGDVGIGTVTCDTSSTLGSTEQNIVSTTTIAQEVAGVGHIHALKAAVSYHDGTTTAVPVYLNILYDDADSSSNDTLSLTGTIDIYWLNQGDY
jgi:hypothetical protein